MLDLDAVITRDQAAELLGMEPGSVSRFTKEGWIKKSGAKYQLRQVVDGYVSFLKDENRRGSQSASRNRVTDARAQEIELRIAQKGRQLIELTEATDALDVVVGKFRSEIEGLPARFTRDLEQREKLETEVNGILTRISKELGQQARALQTGELPDEAVAEDDA